MLNKYASLRKQASLLTAAKSVGQFASKFSPTAMSAGATAKGIAHGSKGMMSPLASTARSLNASMPYDIGHGVGTALRGKSTASQMQHLSELSNLGLPGAKSLIPAPRINGKVNLAKWNDSAKPPVTAVGKQLNSWGNALGNNAYGLANGLT